MKCQRVLDGARLELNDPDEVRWPNTDLLSALNDALLALLVVRPDAKVVTGAILLSQGTMQSLPTGGTRLMRITRNMGTAGLTPGRAIQIGDMAALDAIEPDWHSAEGDGTVDEYFYDPIVPRTFYVSPGIPASPASYVEASYTTTPAVVVNPKTEDLPVDDVYAPALREWMLYRCWGGDDESSPNYSQAQARLRTFMDLLGVKSQTDVASSARSSARKQQ